MPVLLTPVRPRPPVRGQRSVMSNVDSMGGLLSNVNTSRAGSRRRGNPVGRTVGRTVGGQPCVSHATYVATQYAHTARRQASQSVNGRHPESRVGRLPVRL